MNKYFFSALSARSFSEKKDGFRIFPSIPQDCWFAKLISADFAQDFRDWFGPKEFAVSSLDKFPFETQLQFAL